MSRYPWTKGVIGPWPPPRKVFCGECKHIRDVWMGGYCASNPGDSWRAPGDDFANPREKNANNDCGEFEKYVPPPPEPPPDRFVKEAGAAPFWKFWK